MKISKTNRISLLIFPLFVLMSSTLFAQKNIAGRYVGRETKRILIIKKNHDFLLLNPRPYLPVFTIDTLSYGHWKLKNGFVILNTPDSINSRDMRVKVKEKYIPNFDSLVIEIDNPYEEFQRENGGARLFSYSFYILSDKNDFGPDIYMKSNKISLYKAKDDKMETLDISIIPNSFLYPEPLAFNYLNVNTYTFKNRNANYIQVYIPNFTLEYIGYERFKDEYVKTGFNKLILRGETFEKQVKKAGK